MREVRHGLQVRIPPFGFKIAHNLKIFLLQQTDRDQKLSFQNKTIRFLGFMAGVLVLEDGVMGSSLAFKIEV